MILKYATAILLLAGSGLLVAAQTPEAAWATKRLEDSRWQVRRQAVLDLESTTPDSREANLVIVHALGDVDSRVRRAAAQVAGRKGIHSRGAVDSLIALMQDPDPTVRQAAAEALGSLGRDARKAVPDLLDSLQDESPHVRRVVLETLGKIGPAKRGEATQLSQQLADKDADVRAAAAEALSDFGKAARPPLIRALQDDSPDVRQAAAQALGQMGRAPVPDLVDALHSGNPTVLEAVLEAVAVIGAPAIGPLLRLLQDEDEPSLARQHAALGLGRIGGTNPHVVNALIHALEDPDPGLRLAVVRGLAQLNPPASESVPALIRGLADVNEDILLRKHAAGALGRLGATHADAVAALVEALDDRHPVLHDATVAALAEVAAQSSPPDAIAAALSARTEELTHPERTTRLSAIQALGQLGPLAAPAGPSLSAVVRSATEDDELRGEATTALGLIGPRAQSAVPVLIAAMKVADSEMRQRILLAIQRIGPPPQDTLPRLMRLMGQADVESREATALEMRRFALKRLESWGPLLALAQAPVLRTWVARHAVLYGIKNLPDFTRPRDDGREATSLFHVLGGMAAVRETIQTQPLVLSRSKQEKRPTIPIDRIKGVEVESLDFEELLKEDEGTDSEFPLAHLVPQDRLMAYFARPGSLMKVLDESSTFAARLRSILTKEDVDYDLSGRYVARLGLQDPAVMTMLATADIKDLVVLLPDLFLVDGTDITAIIRCSRPGLAQLFLKKAGVTELEGEHVLEHRTGPRTSAWWAIRDDLILVSTSRADLDTVLKLHRTGGRGSLGRSDEFRYMLRRLPLLPDSQAYVYLSDPFLRGLVGPATKIAQYRRMQARRDLEILTSMGLLYKLDGHPGVPSCDTLQRLGYLAGGVHDDYSLGPDLAAVSEQHGTVAALYPLSRNPVTTVTHTEADAYQAYIKSYSRFWQQFFDPIAIRVDEPALETIEITTFILPLIKSSLYEGVRDFLPRSGPRVALAIPVLSPPPILTFSMNLNDAMRVDLTRQFAEEFTDYTSVASEVLDSLGPSLHLAIHDSNPIVALGSGDILRAFGAGSGGGSEQMFSLTTLVSLLTQPCQILVEVQDTDPVVAFLEEASLAKARKGVPGELYKVEGEERWVYHVNLENLVRLSVSVEVKNGYLVIGNLPWSQQAVIGEQTTASLNGAQLVLNLDAMQAHLPALHMATMTDYRAMTVEGIGYLYPLLASGHASTVAEAQALHADLFGYAPVHPAGGNWVWENGTLSSSMFGTLERPRQPIYDPRNQAFGLIQGIGRISVNMQLEDEGLRARLRWSLATP